MASTASTPSRRALLGAFIAAPLAISIPAAAQGHASAPIGGNRHDGWRAEYRSLFHQCDQADGDDATQRVYAQMAAMQRRITNTPARTLAEAQSQIRFLVDQDELGMELAGDEIMALLRDIARFMV
ncbi:MAG TPA: hypothetical protein VF592_03660 [Sphingomonas sp.]|jgi:hypothetical protein|uniref:hypothetical protein n=1 Tax=Sphingomonas sp. TaxID=28214 RepID=UPI002ED9F6E5